MTKNFSFGTTFSQVQCRYLGFSPDQIKQAYLDILDLGFGWIRLGSHWDEIEAKENTFNFTQLDWYLKEAQKRDVNIVLTVGIKAPRYPEFYFPEWVIERFPKETSGKTRAVDHNPELAWLALKFIEKVVKYTRDCPNIKYFQVENEPLVRVNFAGNRYLSLGFLQKELALVTKLKQEKQKIEINHSKSVWPIPIPGYHDRTHLNHSIKLADAVGLDVYAKVPLSSFIPFPFKNVYLTPFPFYFWNRVQSWYQKIIQAGKEAWITECQAEPWEHGSAFHIQKREYPSSNPEMAEKLALKFKAIGYKPILLWGCEHWYYHKIHGHMEWWEKMQHLAYNL
ncbi:MAG: beta-galactosidase [Candidatus Daviesbacteria bacterium]